MKIGIDIDGVLTDIEQWQLDYGSKFFYEKYGYMVLYIITIPHFFYYSSQSYIFPYTTIILG